jgi:hypothetical protein
VTTGGTLQFSAAVAGEHSPSQTVDWSITTTGTASGTSINADGLLTVASGETKTSLTIKATSQQDTSKSGIKTVTVVTPNINAITRVSISGAGFVGEVITATAKDASGNVVTDAAFQWKRANDEDGTGAVSITGATSATYTLAEADVGKYITVEAKNAQTTTAVSTGWGGPVTERPYSIVITGIPATVLAKASGGVQVGLAPAGAALTDLIAGEADWTSRGSPLGEVDTSGSGPYTVTMALYALEKVTKGDETYQRPSGAFRTNGTYDVYVVLLEEDEDHPGHSSTSGVYQKTGVSVSGETTTIAFSVFTDITSQVPSDDDEE